MNEQNIQEVLDLNEKISLLSGENIWHTRAQPKIGLKSLTLRDGPHGIRDGTPSFCYPNINLLACSWDRKLLYEAGKALGADAKEHGVNVLLAPGVNVKRNPLCGRNFEYFSEEPYLAGELAAAYVNGVQSLGVAACVKHFCCNNRENGRYSYSAEVDERTLREVYLKPFYTVIEKANPMSLMTSYNKVNGEYSAQNRKLFDILRNEWCYDGVVVSDWGGVDNRVLSYACGLDLEMPGSDLKTHNEVFSAVERGELSENSIDCSVRRIKKLHNFCCAERDIKPFERDARRLAEESMVLLKNADGLLPLCEASRVAVAGSLALSSLSQGGGCAEVNSSGAKTVFSSLQEAFAKCDYIEKPGVCLAEYDAVIAFVGTSPDSEGYDRDNIFADCSVLTLCAQFNKNTVCVLCNGSALDLREAAANSKAVLETYYAGEVFGNALSRVLTGKVNPSGRLAESFIAELKDSPCYGEENSDIINYGEGVNVGYRYYLHKGVKTVFPFGYGLSYTNFKYSDLTLDVCRADGKTKFITAEFFIENIGARNGKEVVQIYFKTRGERGMPVLKLVAFDKLFLRAGERKKVAVRIDTREFMYYDTHNSGFKLPEGRFAVCVCRNAESEILSTELTLTNGSKVDRYTTVGEIIRTEKGAAIVKKELNKAICGCITDDENYSFDIRDGHITGDVFFRKVAESLQLRQTVTMSNNRLSNAELERIINLLNN